MKKNTFLFCASLLAGLALTSCGGNPEPTPTPSEAGPKAPIVFVMSGQSNMEGNTNFGTNGAYLTKAFEDLGITDGETCLTGIDSVLTSYYGNGYGELDRNNYNRTDVHASNTEDKIKGKFFATKIGMGHTDSMMGPELGCAYVLKEHATAEEPIYLVKMASSGSGFAQSGSSAEGKNWEVKTADGTPVEHNLYVDFLKPFLKNNLDLIEEETGIKPVVKGWLWHQGESDGGEEAKRNAYARRLSDMIGAFRTDFAEYAKDEDGSNIAFIDGMTFEGGTMLAGAADAKKLNEIKAAAADENDNRYIVDTYANEEHTDANLLKVSGEGSTQGVHYNTKDEFRLGMAYGRLIVEKGLLD
ncbi:MAG: sialate O-acetylesterase [Bacilli bacterium]|nr:sialate O-acetylesterase [Bacilli bacterium]